MSRDHLGQFTVGSNLGFARGVQLLEDCEGTCNWSVSGTGGDDVHAFATVAAFMGLNGLRLKTRVTGAAENDYVMLSRAIGLGESGLIVFRGRLALPAVTGVKYVSIGVGIADGDRLYAGWMSWTQVGGAVLICGPAGAGVASGVQATGLVGREWVTWELVIDGRAMEYEEVAFNGSRARDVGVALWDSGADAHRWVGLDLMVWADANAPAEMYVDNMYVGEFLDL